MSEDKIIFSMAGLSKVYPPQKKVLKNIYLSFFYGAKIGNGHFTAEALAHFYCAGILEHKLVSQQVLDLVLKTGAGGREKGMSDFVQAVSGRQVDTHFGLGFEVMKKAGGNFTGVGHFGVGAEISLQSSCPFSSPFRPFSSSFPPSHSVSWSA